MGLRSYLPPGGLVAGQVEVGEVVRGTKRGPRPLTGTGRGHAFERGAEVGRTCQAGAGRLEGWLRELRPERRLGLRVPGWDFGAPGARPQATLWVFDLRTSWHLDKLLVLGVGGSAQAQRTLGSPGPERRTWFTEYPLNPGSLHAEQIWTIGQGRTHPREQLAAFSAVSPTASHSPSRLGPPAARAPGPDAQ